MHDGIRPDINYYTTNPDLLIGPVQQGQEHPTPEQLLLRIAVDKALTHEQRKIWEYYNYDKLTDAEIGRKLKVSRQTIGQRIKVIEGLITKYCHEHLEVYNVLKALSESEPDGC